jgi:hypothetical protein
MAKWIEFVEDTPPAWKTKAWRILSKQHSSHLGWVKWWGGWRKYCFFPTEGSLFEQDCLRDIADFCESKTVEYRLSKQSEVLSGMAGTQD